MCLCLAACCGLWTEKLLKEEEEKREVGSSERHYGWGEQNISSVLKVPRHCPFVLLVSVSFEPVLLKFNFFLAMGG
jgi:hypothetical protein